MRTLIALGLGAVAMYYLDPQQGRRRRAQVREQIAHARSAMHRGVEGRMKDLRDRAQGTVAEAENAVDTARERLL